MAIKRQSISTKINLILGAISAVILIFSITIIYLSNQINSATERVVEYDLPEALNTLAMLEELGDMNSNLLEYLLGEEEEKQEYFDNYFELIRFGYLIPEDIIEKDRIDRVLRLVEQHKLIAIAQVFETYDPIKERKTAAQIDNLIQNVGIPLEQLLAEMKEEEITDAGTTNSLSDIISDDLPGIRFYLELTDAAGDMLAYLDRFVLADQNAKREFFMHALQFEAYLTQLKPLEQRPMEIIRINEIERLFNELKEGGRAIFEQYETFNKISATKAIDNLEHQIYSEAENLLDHLSDNARQVATNSMGNLSQVSQNISLVLIFSTILIIGLVLSMIVITRRTIFKPLETVTETIEKMRKGDRDFELQAYDRNDELTQILTNLAQFQAELAELDELRLNEKKIQKELVKERDNATHSLLQLQETQSKLIATEKMASLGTLVAGVAHEVNTPLGVSVTVSSTLAKNLQTFIGEVKTGVLNRSRLESFEADANHSIEILESSLQQAAHLIHSFKQVAVDQTSNKRREFNLYDTVEEISQTLHHKIKNTNIKLSIQGPQDITLDSYPGPFGQVITNLFNNALLHGFEESSEGEIQIRFSQTGNNVILFFTDNGKGIPESDLKKLFDPFFTTKLGKGGSGLGLNIVQNIVTSLMGGEIQVDNRVGTTFELTLPLIAPYSKESNYE
jgi:signal transduction histidine kinase